MKLQMMAVLMLLAGSACAGQLKVVDVTLQSPNGIKHVVKAEVADTDETRQKGLMQRLKLGEDEGMVFVWSQPQQVGFWMKDTLIPLDMIFVNGGAVAATVENTRPMDETVIPSPVAVDAVLEVNAGWVARHKLGPGWKVTIGK